MRKALICICVLVTFFSTANHVHAAWWNPTTWFKTNIATQNDAKTGTSSQQLLESENLDLKTQIADLRSQLTDLQDKYLICRASDKSLKPSTVSTPPSQSSTVNTPLPIKASFIFNNNDVSTISISEYVADPNKETGRSLILTGALVKDFIPRGIHGLTANAILVDGAIIYIDDGNDYDKIIYSLKKGQHINVWVVGGQIDQFHLSDSTTESSYLPVLHNLQRIDVCGNTCTINILSNPTNTFIKS